MIDLPFRSRLMAIGKSTGAVAAVFLLAAFGHVCALLLHSVENNECITLQTIALDWAGVWRERIEHNHMPIYFLALKAWTQWAGSSELALRLPSAACVWAGLFFFWRIAVRLLPRGAALAALAWLAFNEVAFSLAADARPYGWLWLACVASLWSLIGWLATGRARYWWALLAAGLFGLAGHLLYAAHLAAMLVYLAVFRRGAGERWRAALAGVALPVVLWSPVALAWAHAQDKLGGGNQQPAVRVFELAAGQIQTLVIGELNYSNVAWKGLSTIAAAVLGAALAGALIRRGRRIISLPFFPLVATTLLLPVAGTIIAQMFTHDLIADQPRYYTTALASLPLFAMMALPCGWQGVGRGARRALAALEVVFALCLLANAQAFVLNGDSGLRPVAHYIKAHKQPGDVLIASRRKNRTLAFQHYGAAEQLPLERPAGVESEADIIRWTLAQTNGQRRIWAIFYEQPKRDRLARALDAHPELFAPHGAHLRMGQTALRLYEIRRPSPAQP